VGIPCKIERLIAEVMDRSSRIWSEEEVEQMVNSKHWQWPFDDGSDPELQGKEEPNRRSQRLTNKEMEEGSVPSPAGCCVHPIALLEQFQEPVHGRIFSSLLHALHFHPVIRSVGCDPSPGRPLQEDFLRGQTVKSSQADPALVSVLFLPSPSPNNIHSM